MYSPVKDGIDKTFVGVIRGEVRPTSDLAQIVDCFWELKSTGILQEDFVLHAIPDACVNIMFNELEVRIAGVTALQTSHLALNLGREFHYVGIQFFPGVWQGNRGAIANHFIGDSYAGSLPLLEVNQKMVNLGFEGKVRVMEGFVRELIESDLVNPNVVCTRLLENLEHIHSVTDMAEIAGLSTRQLQRNLKAWTGFSPSDFLKVLRLQQAMKLGFPVLYADQSHFIHSFKSMTGLTPGKFRKKFDV